MPLGSGPGKGQELDVYGPNLTEEITQKIIVVFGFRVRLASPSEPPLQPAGIRKLGDTLPRIPPTPKAKDVGVGEVASGKDWQVTVAVAEHCQTYLDSLAYRSESRNWS